MKKAIDFSTIRPVYFLLLVTLILFGIMCYLNSKDVGEDGFSWHDLLVEANGVVFDLIVFSTLLYAYEELKKAQERRRERIGQLKKEIDEYRGCDDKMVSYRIAGVIKQLTKDEKVYDLDLNRVYVRGTNLSGLKLNPKSNLSGATFYDTDLTDAILPEAVLHDANLFDAKLIRANLVGADLRRSNLTNTDLWGADLSGADLLEAFLEKQFIGNNYDWFEQLESWRVVGREEIREKYDLKDEGKNLVFRRKPTEVNI